MLPSTYFSRYEKLLNQLYIEPKSKEIVGTFLTIANEKGKQADANPRQQKKTTGEETSEIKGHSGYVAKPKMRKGWRQENQLLPCLNKISFCVFQGWKNCKILAFRNSFMGNNFRDCYLIEYLAGIYF